MCKASNLLIHLNLFDYPKFWTLEKVIIFLVVTNYAVENKAHFGLDHSLYNSIRVGFLLCFKLQY